MSEENRLKPKPNTLGARLVERGLVTEEQLNPEHILPMAFDEGVADAVAAAVAKAARETGVARI